MSDVDLEAQMEVASRRIKECPRTSGGDAPKGAVA